MARGLLFGPGAFFFGKYKIFLENLSKYIKIRKNLPYITIQQIFWGCFIFKLGCLVGVLCLGKGVVLLFVI
jgi:hypothetical protein